MVGEVLYIQRGAEPLAPVFATGIVTDALCTGGDNGSIVLTASGGVSPYQFSWSNGSTDQDQSGLLAGEYEVTITDSYGCDYSTSFTVSEPAEAISVTAYVTDMTCTGEASGSISLSVNGGVSPYQYAWSNGSTSKDLTDLSAGFYSVTVTDANGCKYTWAGEVMEQSKAVLSGNATFTEGI